MVDKGIGMETHTRNLPSVSEITSSDKRFEKCGEGMECLKKIYVRFHWNSYMIAVCLRIFFTFVYNFNWDWTQSAYVVGSAVNLRRHTVLKFANDYDVTWSRELQIETRGRGYEMFISNHGRDKYSALKKVLLLNVYA